MRQRGRRMDPFKPFCGERQLGKEWRTDRHGVNGRAKVMQESRQSELGGARSAAGHGRSFAHFYPASSLGQNNRGSQAVRAASNDDGIGLAHAVAFIVDRSSRMQQGELFCIGVILWLQSWQDLLL